jgi:hypothetical protein
MMAAFGGGFFVCVWWFGGQIIKRETNRNRHSLNRQNPVRSSNIRA